MHVLLITSEDLNEKNTFASIFELAQAKALQELGHKVAVLSVGYYTTTNLAKAFTFRLLSKEYGYYRFADLKSMDIVVESIRSIFRSLNRKTFVRKLIIKGTMVYEAFFNQLYFKSNESGHAAWVRHGFKGFEEYIKDHGSPDIIHAHSRFLLAGLLAKKIKEHTKINYILTEHSSYYVRDKILPFQKPLITSVINNSSEFLVVSSTLGNVINEKLRQKFNFKIVPNIIDPHFEEVEHNSEKTKIFTFLNIASLNENKNHSSLIKAFALFLAKHKNAVLRIAGNGEELQSLQKLVANAKIKDKVKFLGHLQHDQVRREMLQSDIFVLSSNHETFGVVIIEALACGKPVIATKCGGPEDIVTDQNGLLVPVNDEEALAKAMIKIYENLDHYDPVAIRKECLEIYSGKAVAKQLSDIYKNALRKRS